MGIKVTWCDKTINIDYGKASKVLNNEKADFLKGIGLMFDFIKVTDEDNEKLKEALNDGSITEKSKKCFRNKDGWWNDSFEIKQISCNSNGCMRYGSNEYNRR